MEYDQLRDQYGGFDLPRFDFTVGSTTFQEREEVVADLVVDATVDGADHFSATLVYPFDFETREFEGLDWDLFTPDTSISISMGYGDDRTQLFAGTISSIQARFDAESVPSVQVSGYGPLHEMMRGTASRSWDELTDSDVVRDVASAYAFSEVVVDDTGVTHRKIVQDRQSDYRFLDERATRYGFEFFSRLDALFFRAPDYERDPVVTLRYGGSLESFEPEINTASQVESIDVRHWDPTAKEELVGSATASGDSGGSGTAVIRAPVRSLDEATRLAEGALARVSEGLVHARGQTIGIPELVPGETVHVADVSERFSRDYYIEQATHRLGPSGYTTSFELSERAL